MSKVISIGEALIDFIPLEKGIELKDVVEFKRVAGGAPANVCACVSNLGKEALMVTKLGQDAFGDYIIKTLAKAGVNTSHIVRTSEANTGLAFVSLKADGNRDFSFYRNPSADMLLEEKDIDPSVFKEGDILHFCSVDLIDAPVRKAHDKALKLASEKGTIISFDPNVRLALWEDHVEYKRIINHYIDTADILKISDEEFEFITDSPFSEERIASLFRGNVKVIIYTLGAKGARVYTKRKKVEHKGFTIDAIDTTGSGDSFIGAFIYSLLESNTSKEELGRIDYTTYVEFANAVGAIVASKKGAIESMPGLKEVEKFIINKTKNS